ncbi:MAG TPA: nucleoside monophosphate kinase [Candidatus Paceibacterota bacterium]
MSLASNSQNPITVVFSGPQGSGKGTQVALLKKYLSERSDKGIISIEMGALLRSLVEGNTEASKRVADVIHSGNILPSFVPVYVFTRELFEKFEGSEHLIFEGVARKTEQSRMLNDELHFFGRSKYDVISLEIPKEESLKRLKSRAEIEGRIDDLDEKAMLRRLDWYEKHVVPALMEFGKLGQRVHHVDGLGSVDEIHKRILKALKI